MYNDFELELGVVMRLRVVCRYQVAADIRRLRYDWFVWEGK